MVQLITGGKGTGKTKTMIDMANRLVESGTENVVFLDEGPDSMHDLKHKIRLISLHEYPMEDTTGFIGFLYGVISANYDIEVLFIDDFLEISHTEIQDLSIVLDQIKTLCKHFEVRFILSIGCAENELPEEFREDCIA